MKRAPTGDETLIVRVKGKNLTVTAALHDQVVDKMSRLDKYLDRLQTIEVELSTEKTRDASHHNHVEATTFVAGKLVRVSTIHEDMYAAIDEAVDKLYRQLNRHKERLKGHHSVKPSELVSDEDTEIDVFAQSSPSASADPLEMIHERLELEPMFDDEALAELRDSGQSFYVFLNAHNERINVVYRRKDGGYSCIEPRTR